MTPSLNQGAWIADALGSVKSQTYPYVEHVVVDGGSTDNTLDILKATPSNGALSWSSGSDRGMYDAINRGMRQARGEIASYLNADDLLAPWAIEAVAEVFRSRPDVDVVYGDAVELPAAGLPELKLQVPFIWERIVRYGSLVQPAVFWRRAAWNRVGPFDDDLQFVGDLDLWLRMGKLGTPFHLEEILAAYRVHPAAKTTRFRDAMRLEERRVRAAHKKGGRGSLGHQVRARLSHGVAVRLQILRFVLAVRRGPSAGWARFRADGRPRVRPGRLLGALLPLAGRRAPTRWLVVRKGWLRESAADTG